MGKRGGFTGKRRTVLQLDDGSRKQPTYGLGYRASSEEPVRPEGRLTLMILCCSCTNNKNELQY